MSASRASTLPPATAVIATEPNWVNEATLVALFCDGNVSGPVESARKTVVNRRHCGGGMR